ncbi:MAG: TetR/AcrR family transcriptional regulator [Gemmobacter sp.]|nr:TetR/AcrR family transcriptional regulator [Gemmobacter sp.]
MFRAKQDPGQRQRAPSQRSIDTGLRIVDAAERLFSERGYDGTSTRDIAQSAGVTAALVTFHGSSKLALFETVVERRAHAMSAQREAALALALASPSPTLEAVLGAFIRPLMSRALCGDTQWLAYARLVAMVSADARWAPLAARCFDPTAAQFMAAVRSIHPQANPQDVAAGFVFTVSAMLSLCTSEWRIMALAGPDTPTAPDRIDQLIAYAAAGLRMLIAPDQPLG